MIASRRSKLGGLAVALALLFAGMGEVRGEVREETLKLTAILCSGCVPRIHRALEGRPGVHKVAVDLNSAEVRVWYDDQLTSSQQLAGWLKAAGFPTNGQNPCRGWRQWLGRC